MPGVSRATSRTCRAIWRRLNELAALRDGAAPGGRDRAAPDDDPALAGACFNVKRRAGDERRRSTQHPRRLDASGESIVMARRNKLCVAYSLMVMHCFVD